MIPDFDNAAIWLPMVASIFTGAAIGFEREWKAKSAGVRTHALVCFSCAILMMAASRQGDWVFVTLPDTSIVSDPTRMAHGILTGIGFLGAGVIFKQGNGVQALTTAPTVWMTASLGVLYGAGLTMLAFAGTLTALVVLVIFRLFHSLVPDRMEVTLEVTCAGSPDPTLVTAIFERHAVKVSPIAWKREIAVGPDLDPLLHLTARLWLHDAEDAANLDRTLQELDGIISIAITPVTDADRVNW